MRPQLRSLACSGAASLGAGRRHFDTSVLARDGVAMDAIPPDGSRFATPSLDHDVALADVCSIDPVLREPGPEDIVSFLQRQEVDDCHEVVQRSALWGRSDRRLPDFPAMPHLLPWRRARHPRMDDRGTHVSTAARARAASDGARIGTSERPRSIMVE